MNSDTIFSPSIDLARAHSTALVDGEHFAGSACSHSTVSPFKIERADHVAQRSLVNGLIDKRYTWRGYGNTSLPQYQTADRVTFCATRSNLVIGTITVGLDGGEPLHADAVFADVIGDLRTRSPRVCEFTRLAVDSGAKGSKQVLASLFHVAFILAHRVRGCEALVVEVNPRHTAYYQSMLGFKILSGERMHPAVGAPAVLLTLDFAYIRRQLDIFGGRPELGNQVRSLYPYSFDDKEEYRIFQRLIGADIETRE